MNDDYAKLLQDPRWLKKRDRILKRDKYACTVCGLKHNLHVHHTYYLKGGLFPWLYPDESLLTVCGDCHDTYHKQHENVILDQHPNYKPKQIKPYRKKKTKQKKKIFEVGKKYSREYLLKQADILLNKSPKRKKQNKW
jgi:5-methylcytosine-specific restriction endonuclease McrA